jgi:hypothetical protein
MFKNSTARSLSNRARGQSPTAKHDRLDPAQARAKRPTIDLHAASSNRRATATAAGALRSKTAGVIEALAGVVWRRG